MALDRINGREPDLSKPPAGVPSREKFPDGYSALELAGMLTALAEQHKVDPMLLATSLAVIKLSGLFQVEAGNNQLLQVLAQASQDRRIVTV